MEIGSYFLIEETLSEHNNTLECYLNQFAQNQVYFDSGRSAMRFLCRLCYNKTVWLPNYLCDSMLQPFLEEDYKIYFYEIDDNLEPIISSIKIDNQIGMFVYLGYFGRSSSEKLQETIHLLKSLGSIVVEDITHSIFSTKLLNIESDYYVCSIRKWLGVCDGGLLLSNHKIEFLKKTSNSEVLTSYKKGSELKKYQSIKNTLDYLHINHFKQVEESLNLSKELYSISTISYNILKRYDFNKMVSIRRENAEYLSRELNNLGFKTLHFNMNLNTPIFIPIFFAHSQERDFYRFNLIDSKIYTPIHWTKPNLVDVSNEIYDKELSIPCDQRYTLKDMERIITEFKRIMEIKI